MVRLSRPGGRAGRVLRLAWLWPFIVLQTVVWSLVSISLFVVDFSGRLTHRYGAVPWSRILLWASGVRVDLKGRENLAADDGGPLVLVCNHQSLFDVLALLARLPLDFKFVVKRELRKVPLWGYAMDKAGYLFIDREAGGDVRGLIQEAAGRLESGSSMLFFVEGTRSADGHLAGFKRGAFVLASRSGRPVVPVVIEGSRRVVPKGSREIRPGRITLTVLPAIKDPAVSKNSRRLQAAVREAMLSALGEPPAA
jgi:1-acyl-sn-glycerol-3-phosphate acyltransferase